MARQSNHDDAFIDQQYQDEQDSFLDTPEQMEALDAALAARGYGPHAERLAWDEVLEIERRAARETF